MDPATFASYATCETRRAQASKEAEDADRLQDMQKYAAY
jgi:hypothetical protein